jgi:hypothetical protein
LEVRSPNVSACARCQDGGGYIPCTYIPRCKMHGLSRDDRHQIDGSNLPPGAVEVPGHLVAIGVTALSTWFQINLRLHNLSTLTLFLASSLGIPCSPSFLLAASLRARHHAQSRHPRGRLLVRAGRADRLGASGAAVVLLPMRGLCTCHPGEAGSIASTKVSTARCSLLRIVVSWSWFFRGDHLPTCAYR